MEKSAAKRARLEHNCCQTAEEIIQEQNQIIENLKARNQKLEEVLEEVLKNPESSAMQTRIRNVLVPVPVPKLPNEILLEILSYLPTRDLLRNVARVSKRFHELSEDPHLIRKIEVESVGSWPKDKEEKYCHDFLRVLKRSLKLKSLSFGFSSDINYDKSEEMFLEALPSMNHQFLEEFILKGDGKIDCDDAAKFLAPVNENILKYLEKCPELKVLKLEFRPEVEEFTYFPLLSNFYQSIMEIKLKSLQEFHLIGMDIRNFIFDGDASGAKPVKFLETIAENMPKLQRLCLACDDYNPYKNDIFQAFVWRKDIEFEIEISSVYWYTGGYNNCGHCHALPSRALKIFKPY